MSINYNPLGMPKLNPCPLCKKTDRLDWNDDQKLNGHIECRKCGLLLAGQNRLFPELVQLWNEAFPKYEGESQVDLVCQYIDKVDHPEIEMLFEAEEYFFWADEVIEIEGGFYAFKTTWEYNHFFKKRGGNLR